MENIHGMESIDVIYYSRETHPAHVQNRTRNMTDCGIQADCTFNIVKATQRAAGFKKSRHTCTRYGIIIYSNFTRTNGGGLDELLAEN